MVVSERGRRALHQKLVAALGEREADSLMEYLPPVGWADLVRQSDMAAFRIEMHSEMNVLRSDMAAMESRLLAEIHRSAAALTRTFILSMVGTLIAMGGGLAGMALAITH